MPCDRRLSRAARSLVHDLLQAFLALPENGGGTTNNNK
jgi:hypothetical protein